MKKIANIFRLIIEITIAVSLLLMCILVLGNVILRYIFNEGIIWSEEAARYLFMLLIFLGTIIATINNEHLGVDILVRKFSNKYRRLTYVGTNLIVITMLILLIHGCWKLVKLNVTNFTVALNMPLSYIYYLGIFFCVGTGIVLINNIIGVIRDPKAIELLGQLNESEEDIDRGHKL